MALLGSEPWGHSNQILLILQRRSDCFLHYMNSPKMSGLWNKKKSPFHCCVMRTSLRIRQGERGGGCWQCVEGGEVVPGLLLGRVRILSHSPGPPVLRVRSTWSSQRSECEQLLHPSGSWSRIYMGWLAWGILNFLLTDKSLFSLSLMLFRSLLIWQE